MDKSISLEGRGVVPCPHNIGEIHVYKGPPLPATDLTLLLCRAAGRHAQLGVAIDNLRRILVEEHVLCEERGELPHTLLEEVRQALGIAQAVIPGGHREALARVTQALERVDAYQDALPQRGLA